MPSKNAKLLAEFTEYCEKHPDHRFWQALRNWSEAEAILFVRKKADWEADFREHEDTFYFENKTD